MNPVTQPVTKQSRPAAANRSAKDWLDVLASGACGQDEFWRGVGDLLRRSPDTGWELLGLIDQYHRRGRLDAATFGVLKNHLQAMMVGGEMSEDVNAPPPRMQDDPPSAPRAAAVPHAATVPQAATVPHAVRSLVPGDLLRGRYLVQGLLGQGGMGTVYAAIDQFRADPGAVDQKVAIKVLHNQVIERPRLFAELRREFQHLQTLSHPNVVRVHEFDRDGDLAFFTMEHLSGTLLSQALLVHSSVPLPRPYALALIRDVAAAVAHAHSRGVVHGDLNPGNIFITDAGEVRVLDFGASHPLHSTPWISEFDSSQPMTVATPGFASCQVLEGETADARDDVYALAVVAYLLLTGVHPFGENTALKARALHLTPSRPTGLKLRQWQALQAGLQFDREQRPGDLNAWIDTLDLTAAVPRLPQLLSLWSERSFAAREPRRAARIPAGTWLKAGVASLALLGGVYWIVQDRTEIKSQVGDWMTRLTAGHPDPVIIAPADMEAVDATTPNTDPAPVAAATPAPPVAVRPASVPTAKVPVVTHTAVPRAAAPVPPAPVPSSAVEPAAVPAGNRPHVELAADNVEVAPGEPMAHIVVRRKGSKHGDIGFSWWTESGTAKPGRDFVPVKTQVEHIEDGQNAVSLIIPVVRNPVTGESRSFYVVIDQASDNAVLGPRTLTMVTIPGNEPDPPADP